MRTVGRTRRCAFAWMLSASAALAPAVRAQSSASYAVTEGVLNAGGRPDQMTIATSASYRMSHDAVGDGALGAGLSSASFRMDGGFVASHPPAGEVAGLRFADKTTLAWTGDPASLTYDLYRDPLTALPASFGACLESGVASLSATDASSPSPGVGWFYLVTGKNRLGEEGTMGPQSSGATRPNAAPCP